MALLTLYRKDGKKYKTELRPARIEILILPLLVCFLLSVVVWSYATGHARPEEETVPADTRPPVEETAPDTADPADSEAQPSDM